MKDLSRSLQDNVSALHHLHGNSSLLAPELSATSHALAPQCAEGSSDRGLEMRLTGAATSSPNVRMRSRLQQEMTTENSSSPSRHRTCMLSNSALVPKHGSNSQHRYVLLHLEQTEGCCSG